MSTRKSVNGRDFFTIACVFRINIFTLFCYKLVRTENVFPAGVSVTDNCLILFSNMQDNDILMSHADNSSLA